MSRIWNDQLGGTIKVAKSKALTYVTIWCFLCRKLSRGNLVRSPSARGETSKRRTSSFSRSIEIEKPRSFHNLGCPETVFQAQNSRANACVKERSTKCHKKTKARHTSTGFSSILPNYQSKSITVDITEILIYTIFNSEWKIFTATSWPLQTPRWTLPNKPLSIYCPMVVTVTKSSGLMVVRKRRAVESVLAKCACTLSELEIF